MFRRRPLLKYDHVKHKENKKKLLDQRQCLIDHRVEWAKKYGWKVGTRNGAFVNGPDKYECIGWGAEWNEFKLKSGQTIMVPHYFWNSNIVRYGKWEGGKCPLVPPHV